MLHHSAVFLCAAKRTAIGSFQGALAEIPAPRLGSTVIEAVLSEARVPPESIDSVILGCVLTAGTGQAPARQAAIFAGLSTKVQALTVNKVCSSGLKAIMLAANDIMLGHAKAVIAGGMENMSNAPYTIPSMRKGARLGHAVAEDSVIHDSLWDVYNNCHMGNAAELCARTYELSREAQDAFAIESYKRANHAIEQGVFKEEIATVKVVSGKGESVFEIDEEPLKFRPEKIPGLKPVFDKSGTVTAANASSINDGAAAMLVCSEDFVRVHNLKPLARILAQGWNAQAPEWFTTAPVGAIRQALSNAGLGINDIDLFEINEAFSAVALACSKDLALDPKKMNINGGAVALGHPVGASGARILTTLLYSLKRGKHSRGAVGICNGGGEATSLVVERI